MELTLQQREAVRYNENTVLVSCPGSGKTRTIVAKLLRCAEQVRETTRRVACITYTNAAVYEIEDRLRKYGSGETEQYCEVSTIHTFCLANVLGNFFWCLPAYQRGFNVATPEDERFQEIARTVLADFGLAARELDKFAILNREPDGTPVSTGVLTRKMAEEFWSRLEREELIDFPNIVYWSYRLMVKRPSIVHALACHFSWILVDEFQDTSALQVEILNLIAAEGRTKFFLVGDPAQSIYGFAGAKPGLMSEFAKSIKARDDLQLLDNFRSGPPIITHAERVFPRTPPMRAAGEAALFTDEVIHIHADSIFNAITDYFLPMVDAVEIPYGECAVLAPSWFPLFSLGRALREYGVPVFGIGARPYSAAHLFAHLAEHVCCYINAPRPDDIPHIEKQLFRMLSEATGSPNYRIFSYEGRRVVFRLLGAADLLKRKHEDAVTWLKAAARQFETILIEEELLPKARAELLTDSVESMCEDMVKRKIDISNLSVEDLGLFANPERNLKLLTIHGAKGREFTAVVIVDLHEDRIPHWSNKTAGEIEESKRVFYVGLTRARRVLMYVTDSSKPGNIPSRFLGIVLDS